MLWTMGLSLALGQDFVETDTAVLWTVPGSKGGQLGWAVSARSGADGALRRILASPEVAD